MNDSIIKALEQLHLSIEGEVLYDDLLRTIYATDASVYRILPLAVAYPKNGNDIKKLIQFANENETSLIPRTAGTSLAGQCVGEGIIVDVSKYFTDIVHLDEKSKTVTVQPGVVRDELNNYLNPFGLFFGPNTSTSNRCMIGGMVGNNSSGTTSIKYGITRDKVLKLKTILSDGSEVVFENLEASIFKNKLKLQSLEGDIYRTVFSQLNSESVQKQILDNFPKQEIHRRNTGYSIDELLNSTVFDTTTSNEFNMCKLLSGSEGTLAFTTEITLQLDPLPPKESAMIALHFNSIDDCLNAVTPLMKHKLYACEMMDKIILDLTRHNKTQQTNRTFIEGDPKAILLCELKSDYSQDLEAQIKQVILSIVSDTKAYAYPILKGEDINKSFDLRKAGLGLLGNLVGDRKAVACIEDTAVALEDLVDYISEFSTLMKAHKQDAVYYAHAGAGELHLRPILNLKDENDIKLFRTITTDVAHLVKKYRGSFSGEHGDGIVRAEFIPLMIGEANYNILKSIKSTFDPNNIFNPGKIVDALPMDKFLRTKITKGKEDIKTLLDFSESQGILREAEKCNGSGDCRKLPEFGGVMCPSYRATKNEKATTRARANALREFLSKPEKDNRFNYQELKDVFDLCLSCKACKTECPSSVDVASLKAEFQYQFQKVNGSKFRDRFFAKSTSYNKTASKNIKLSNFLISNNIISSIMKSVIGIHKNRSFPQFQKLIASDFITSHDKSHRPTKNVYLFVDEFSKYFDANIVIDSLTLLEKLNYKVHIINDIESGRSFISKGFLEEAKSIANHNVYYFKNKISESTPLIGIEPSAILTLKDEYLRLADDKSSAKQLAKYTFLIEEFIQNEIELGNIKSEQFTIASKTIKFHGHCYQKALSNQKSSFDILNLPKNYKVTIIPSGCCGMAGSFGYEKEHYDVSMKIGEQTLFPAIRKSQEDVIISANGTSCRHQIKDGTGRSAKHPISILKDALVFS